MSSNLINKNNGYKFGYLDVRSGAESITNGLNDNQDFFTDQYFFVKKGMSIEFTSKYKQGISSKLINAIYIHIYDLNKQWKTAILKESSIRNENLTVKYEVTEDCYVRFMARGFNDCDHTASVSVINDTVPRLEKFIYAICSMDVTDLPVPLSRIEKLWNCLITGETPDFEPLSRNEKYLMAMLDRYDISNLPAPMSRGEKLLYKIAVGETDLSDVPGYLSRYEELLKYLIENGGISGGDFEYVLHTFNQSLYTLYTTAKKPVKSAILKGVTKYKNIDGQFYEDFNIFASCKKLINQNLSSDGELVQSSIRSVVDYIAINDVSVVKINGLTIKNLTFYDESKNKITTISVNTSLEYTLDIPEGAKYFRFSYDSTLSLESASITLTTVELASVKMPVLTTTNKIDGISKGLITMSGNIIDVIDNANFTIKTKGGRWTGVTSSKFFTQDMNSKFGTKYVIEFDGKLLKGDLDNAFGVKFTQWSEFVEGYDRELPTNGKYRAVIKSSTIPANGRKTSFSIYTTDGNTITKDVEYQVRNLRVYPVNDNDEVYKSNILTVNEDVELCGIGEVQDTLDLMTGEIVSNFATYTFNGSENFLDNKTSDSHVCFGFNMLNIPTLDSSKSIGLSKDIPYQNWSGDYPDKELIYVKWSMVYVSVSKDKLVSHDVNGLKTFLKERYETGNPISFMYPLREKPIKTVDLTTVDQDNQPTRLGTFENITHVSLESAGLIPEVEMEVATRISKELASASPLMDDISMKQEQLNTTINEQSNNVDATMIATTEIYEETL